MVTKYDVFEFAYNNRAPIKPIDVVRNFHKDEREYHTIHKMLRELVKEDLLEKTNQGFQIRLGKKTDILYDIIKYSLKNNINYNELLDKKITELISIGLQKEELTSKNIKINPRTLKKYIEILDKYGLILILSEKPLRVKVFYNILLNNLLIYFEYKHKVITESERDYFNEIKKELALYVRLRKKNEQKYKKIIDEFEIHFIYHSLSLEGNPITLPDTIKILKENIIPANLKINDVEEIKNYQTALIQMLKDATERKPLNLPIVLDYHKKAMNHLQKLAGNIRDFEVFIQGNPDFKIVKSSEVREELNKLFGEYNQFIKQKKISVEKVFSFAVYFHNEFQHIHPFADGNSRTTRLITFHLLQSRDIPVFDIPLGLLDEYLNYTKGSKKREDEKLLLTLQKTALFNLKKINERLRR
jgi:fido (protein-threonine AMPylation protein)